MTAPDEHAIGVVRIQIPWWQRAAATVAAACLAVTLLLFAVGSWVDRVNAHRENADLRGQVAALQAQTNQTRSESECRAQRLADLAATTSAITGKIAALVVSLANREGPAGSAPLVEQMGVLSQQRDVDDAAARSAVAECKDG